VSDAVGWRRGLASEAAVPAAAGSSGPPGALRTCSEDELV